MAVTAWAGPARDDLPDLAYVVPPDRALVSLHPPRLSPARAVAATLAAAFPARAGRRIGERLGGRAGGAAGHWVLAASGRAALCWALRQLGAGPGSTVVLSTFNCAAVIDAVLATGATPVLVDCDPHDGVDFGDLDLAGRLVVLTNALGLDEWHRHGGRLRARGARPVLDLAQAVPAPAVAARYAHTGCPLVFSFGPGKPLGGIGGGAVWHPAPGPAGDPAAPLGGPVGATAVPSGGPVPPSREPDTASAGPGFAELWRQVGQHALDRAPATLRDAAGRRTRRSPGWSHTKAAHLPTEPEPITVQPPGRWQVAAAAVLLSGAARLHQAVVETHRQVLAAVGDQLATCRVVPSTPDLTPGLELVFHDRGVRYEFARVLARHGVPATWNHYPLHRMAPYRRFANGRLAGADHLWPRVLTIPKQRQPRLSARLLADALLAADREVRRKRGGDA